jgi:hypothetical protein
MTATSEDLSTWLASVETIDAATERVAWLYSHIEKHHGPEQARGIFLSFGKKMGKNRIREMKNRGLLWRYDQMEEPNVAALAREIVEKNAERSKEDQLTPGFRPSLPTVDKHLRLLIEKRAKAERDRRALKDDPRTIEEMQRDVAALETELGVRRDRK